MADYTVTIRNQTFKLTEEQIKTDSPNFFTSFFLSCQKATNDEADSVVAKDKAVVLHRNPLLFEIIQEYLSGYSVFPIREGYIAFMTTDTLLQNLLKDALFYGLHDFAEQIEAQMTIEKPRENY